MIRQSSLDQRFARLKTLALNLILTLTLIRLGLTETLTLPEANPYPNVSLKL